MTKNKITVLLAEDTADIRELYTTAFTDGGFNVIAVENGKLALAELEKHKDIDIVVTDIEMPVMDGFKLLEEIRKVKKYNKIPIIVASNLDAFNTEKKVKDLGANKYIVKCNVTPMDVAEMIKELLKK